MQFLFERVAFEPAVQTADGYGGFTTVWGSAVEVPARFMYLRNGEAVMAGRLAGRSTIVVTIRANETTRTINGTWRMRDLKTEKVYNVRSATPVRDDRRYIEVLVEGGEA